MDDATIDALAECLMANEHIQSVDDFDSIDFSMFEEEYRLLLFSAIGDICVENFMLIEAAEKAYTLADDKEELSALGRKYLRDEQDEDAERVFKLAGSTEGLEKLGESYSESGRLEDAQRAYTLANSRAGLLSVGDEYLEGDLLKKAEEVFTQIDNKDKLQEVGDAYLDVDNLVEAERLYRLTECTDGLGSVVEGYIEQDELEKAEKLAAELELCDELKAIAEKYEERGDFDQALKNYDLAGVVLDADDFVQTGKNYLNEGWTVQAEKAFRLAGQEDVADFLKQLIPERDLCDGDAPTELVPEGS